MSISREAVRRACMKTKTLLFAAALCCSCSCTTVRQLRAHDTLPVDGKAEKTRTKDALDYSIATRIAATPEQVWAVLTEEGGESAHRHSPGRPRRRPRAAR